MRCEDIVRLDRCHVLVGKLGLVVDLDVAACHGQRAVDGAPALEAGYELRGLGRAWTAQPKDQLDGCEHRYVSPRLPLAVDASAHRYLHVLEWDVRIPREHLKDFGPRRRRRW